MAGLRGLLPGPALTGIAASGDARGLLETIAATIPISLRDDGVALRLDAGAVVTLDGGARVGAVAEDRRAADSIASGIALAYYDPARDYQLGTQRAGRDGAAGEARLDLPATMTADIAKALVEARLAQGWRDRRSLSVTLPWAALTVTAGMQVRLTAVAGVDPAAIWRVEAVLVEAMRVTLTLRPAPPAARVAEGESGRAHAQLDRVHGATTIALIDLPPLGATPAGSPQVAVVANGVSGGWRRAALIASVDGANWVDVGDTARPATLGTLRTRCGDHAAGTRRLARRERWRGPARDVDAAIACRARRTGRRAPARRGARSLSRRRRRAVGRGRRAVVRLYRGDGRGRSCRRADAGRGDGGADRHLEDVASDDGDG